MTRHPAQLAALVDAGVRGAHPVHVEEVVERIGEHFRVGFVEDRDEQRWVVRVPADQVAAALQDQSVALLRLIGGTLPYAVPSPEGFATLRDGRRAMVYPLIPGRVLDFTTLPPGPGLATALGEAIAAIHNLDPALYDEAGLPAYTAAELRQRRQSDIDLGAETGLVPTGLLSRWETMLDDVSRWRFSTRPVHGRLDADHVLVDFPDPLDASTGRITAITSWENAIIGDPADDLAGVLALAEAETAATVLRAYAHKLAEPPDPALRHRATLLRELRVLKDALTATRTKNDSALAHATAKLHKLDEAVGEAGPGTRRGGTPFDAVPVAYTPTETPEDLYSAGSVLTAPLGERPDEGKD